MVSHTYKKILSSIFSFLLIISAINPFIAFGQSITGSTNTSTTGSSAPACSSLFGGNISTLKDIIDYATCLISRSVIPLLFVLAIAMFVWGVVQYFLNPNNAKDRETARKYIIWALIGMFVLVSISGLVQILRVTFGVTGSPIPLLPETQ